MKNFIANQFLFFPSFILLALLARTDIRAQDFQQLYGTSFDNTFTRVIQDGSHYYVLGQDQPTNSGLPHAAVTRLDGNGIHLWTLTLNVPSVWNDAVLTPMGDLMVVGATFPFDAANKSLIGLVTSSGGGNFTWIKSYDVPGREANAKVIFNPAPQNPNFPYYVAGGQFDPSGGPLWDDIFLLNIDDAGNFNWKKKFPSTADDEFARDLEALANGNLILTGNLGSAGVILELDNTGALISGVTPTGLSFTYADVSPSSGGGYYAVGSTFPSFNAYLLKYDNSWITQWQASISSLTAIRSVWEDPGSGAIFITADRLVGGITRTVLINILEIANIPVLQWVRYLDNGETAYAPGFSSLLPSGALAYADGRTASGNGFGQMDAFISFSDPQWTTCITEEDDVFVDPVNFNYDAPNVPAIEFFDFSVGTDLTSSALNWQTETICTEPCHADFIISHIGDCGHYQVTNTSTGNPPLTYSWCNGSTSQDLNVMLPCGPSTFCLTITDATGCTSSYTETITVSDIIPPIAICVPAFGVILDANCEFALTPQMIDGGSSDNCEILSMAVTPSVLQGCGIFPITLTVTDWCGNTNQCMTMVEAYEDIPPDITCPPDVTVAASTTSPCSALVNGLSYLSATNNCGTPFVNYVVTGATSNFGQNDASGLTYNEGVSTVTYTATDQCGNTSSCQFNVTVQCKDTCTCGAFTDMVIRFERGPGIPLTCGSAPVQLGCPPSGYMFTLSGKFECQGNGCDSQAPFDAQLEQPNGMILPLGSQSANPYFGIPLPNQLLQEFGVYTLTLQGHCGNSLCTCVIKFIMDPPCGPVCPCTPQDIGNFLGNAFQGASQLMDADSCTVCFTPVALTSCEVVNYWLDSIAGSPIGLNVPGQQPFCYTFPGAGTYTVIMVMTRIDDNGIHCGTAYVNQTVTVLCERAPGCDESRISNPSFGEGAEAGGLISGGASQGWFAPSGNPEVIVDAAGTDDGWSVILAGNLDTADVLALMEPICLRKMEGMVRVGIAVNDSAPGGIWAGRPMSPRPCDKIKIVLYTGDFDPATRCGSGGCYELASMPLSEMRFNTWNEWLIPYNLRRWITADDCGDSSVIARAAVYVTNALSTDQGGTDTYSLCHLDRVCLSENTVSTYELIDNREILIVPNPNSGTFYVKMDLPELPSLTIRVLNVTGQFIFEQALESGVSTQQVQADGLAAGLYFIQLISRGQVIRYGRFVKNN